MKLKITLSDNSIKEYEKEMILLDVAKDISKSLAKKTLYGIVNGKSQRNDFSINEDSKISLITTDDKNDELINKETSQMLEVIITTHFKEFRLENVSYNSDYFYIDFDIDKPFKESDLTILNNKISKFVKKFKIDSEKFLITNTKFISNFKLLSISGVYLDSDKTKKMINRITGIASTSLENLQTKEKDIKNRISSDHRVIGSKMKIFTFINEIGQGLPIWLPNGTILKNEIKKFLHEKELEYGFLYLETPFLANAKMYKTSGHLAHYKDDMFPPMKKQGEEIMLRPMTCPHHILVFKNDLYSYRDLPLRFSENSYLFRYEKSGALTGLERVRMMELTDSHIFVDLENLKQEFKNCFKLIMEVLSKFKINIDYFSLSLRDKNNKSKFYQDDAMWNTTEKLLKEVLDELKIDYKQMIGEAAFYGPKLDIQIKSVLNHEITVSTIQLDMLSAKNFNATYINKENQRVHPIIIHKGLIGTFERFISILLEQTKGILPLWLCPEQVRIIPVNNSSLEYCKIIQNELFKNKIRCKIDNSDDRLSLKIRNAQVNKIPYQLIIGENEKTKNTVALRKYSEETTKTLKLNKLITDLQTLIISKK